MLDSKSASEPGPYRSSRTPYWIEPMNNLSVTNIVRKVIIMKGAQVGATEIGLNFIGYVIDVAPGPALAVMPTDETVKRNSKMRIAPMIEASPRLREKIRPARAKDSGNTINQKEFPGGMLILTGANSGAGLRSMPVRYLMLDETDGYPMDVDGEGSPTGLAEQRTATFPNKKILEISTPTIQGQSIIEADFETTDKRYYHVPCPFCGCEQTLKFENLRWETGNYDKVEYECAHCNERIQERFKTEMLASGYWVPSAPEKTNPFTVGYHLSSLYSPFGWKSWAEIAEQWDKAQGDDPKLKNFYNTVLGETWKQRSTAPEWERLYDRAEDYPVNKPFADVVFLTAGVDVQGDRLEIEIVGWMEGKRSQSIDYRVLNGDPSKKEVWAELDKIVNEVWEREDGATLPLRLMAIDTGYLASKVYAWQRKHTFTRVIPIKGSESLENYFSAPRAIDVVKHGKKVGKQKVWHVGSSFIKSETYGFLRQFIDPENPEEIPDGYCHFPKRDPHYFRGLTAEVQESKKTTRGYYKTYWVKKYDRNEPLDTRIYARAAAAVIGMDRWTPERWEQERAFSTVHVEKPKAKTTAPKPKAKKTSYWNR
ncbi:phage terminase large subunit family protein [Arachidicoccus terrestris]|uniref:phage terminase large subunit family protein n=1 Tax=Arachidicoccus terrestris TaxID=2875539 RepID=UPI001CC77FEC|nr:phage terminase large subunit family protein [Arachidicoccus terrestris]UAY56256.1 phage terminase large subunit family protein [Arachidicoccus terrestris]